jgi:hypothetical protein
VENIEESWTFKSVKSIKKLIIQAQWHLNQIVPSFPHRILIQSLTSDIQNQVDFPNDLSLVTALGEVFQKYDVHERFGLHLLHRHFVLPENCLMLKSKVDAEISLTKITSLYSMEQIPIRGALHLLNDMGSFQVHEFEHGDTIDIPSFFLEELSGILRKFKMEKQPND